MRLVNSSRASSIINRHFLSFSPVEIEDASFPPTRQECVPMKLGWGKCYEPWCECREYKDPGYGDLCANCGHQYSQHG